MARCLYLLNGCKNSCSSFQTLSTHKNLWSEFPYCHNREVRAKANKAFALPNTGMEKNGEEKKATKVAKLEAIEATPESFQDYGQVILPIPDSQGFGPHDAQLDLSRGTPRGEVAYIRLSCPISTGVFERHWHNNNDHD